MHTPAHWRQVEDEVAKAAKDDLQARGVAITAAVEDQVRRYAQAETEARRLTEEARRHDPASQESRRLTAAAERARRNASTELNRLGALGRDKGAKDARPSLVEALEEWWEAETVEPG